MLRKCHFTISREGLYYLFVLFFVVTGAWLREINLLLMLTGMMIGPFLFNWWAVTTTLYRLSVQRKLPERICADDLLIVELSVTNGRSRTDSWAIALEDQIRRLESPKGERSRLVRVMAPRVRAGQTQRLTYRGRLSQRGHYVFGPVHISTRFPLGLLRRSIETNCVDRLVVYPQVGQLTRRWTQLVQSERVGSHHTRHRHGLVEGDFYGLRNWRSGDSRRWIHWRTSAKRGSLKIRQFEQQRNQNLALLVDLWKPSRTESPDTDHCEKTISFAATVIEDMCRRGGSQIFLGTAGQQVHCLRGAASMGLLYEVMDHLAGAAGSHTDQLPELVNTALERVTPGMKIVVLGPRPNDLSDTERFANTWDDPHKRNAMGQVVCIDVTSAEAQEYYRGSEE